MEKMIFFDREKRWFFNLFLFNIFVWISLMWLSRLGVVTTIGGLPYPRIAFYILAIYINCASIFLSCLFVKFVIVNEKDMVLRTVFKKLKFIEWKNVISIEEVIVNERGKKTYYFIFDGTEEDTEKNSMQSKKTPIKILKTSKSMIWFEHYLDNQKKNSINDN